MKEFMSLKILDKFKGVISKFGFNYEIVRKILQIKLTLDCRKTPTLFNNKAKKEGKNYSLLSMGINIFIGACCSLVFLFGNNIMFQMSLLFAMMMFMIITDLISNFSDVILDIRDKMIIGTKPVETKNVTLAKTIHIITYMVRIVLSLMLVPSIVIVMKYGVIDLLLFIFEMILISIMMIVITTLVYLLILKFFDGEKLKDIINYVQIVLILVITVGYQLVCRVFDFTDLNIEFVPKLWHYFMIPIWFAAPFNLISGHLEVQYIILSLLAVFIPIILALVYIRTSNKMEEYVQKLDNNTDEVKIKKRRLSKVLENICCRDKEEKIFFRFSQDMIRNEREFKLKVYPSLGFSIIFPFIMMIQQFQDRSFSAIRSGKMYLFMYFSLIMLPTIIMMIKYSGKYKGAWIFKLITTDDLTPLFKGVLKGTIVRLYLPIFLVEAIIFIIIFGIRIIPDIIIMLLVSLIISVLTFNFINKAIPFSKPFNEVKQSSDDGISFALIFIIGFIALIHVAIVIIGIPILKYIYMLLLILVTWLSWKFGFKVGINKLEK
ncbi:putative membrane protein [Clostridium bornimense]|uniref:Putative membrane protein n=1 Tax=Clostridium bornimense TaxID=1216932 RepID=W6SHK2_9CLOT|nr:hypothetical protein [Clostridium bornimense]CDM69180.1 putative membrane protein [Clostridium bornimense]